MTTQRKDDLFICRRTVGGGEYEGATCYYVYTPIESYVSPPVPDDVAEALHCAAKAFDGYRFTSQEANKYMDALIAALRAASTPSAEVMSAFELGYTAGCQDTLEGNLSGLRHDEYLKALNQSHTGGK